MIELRLRGDGIRRGVRQRDDDVEFAGYCRSAPPISILRPATPKIVFQRTAKPVGRLEHLAKLSHNALRDAVAIIQAGGGEATGSAILRLIAREQTRRRRKRLLQALRAIRNGGIAKVIEPGAKQAAKERQQQHGGTGKKARGLAAPTVRW
jgi:hypothetical protein